MAKRMQLERVRVFSDMKFIDFLLQLLTYRILTCSLAQIST